MVIIALRSRELSGDQIVSREPSNEFDQDASSTDMGDLEGRSESAGGGSWSSSYCHRIRGCVEASQFIDNPGGTMPTVIGHHDISKGKDHWLASPKREEFFGPLGVTNIRTFVNPENPTQVAVLMDVADLDALMAAMQNEAAAAAMADDGVVPESLVILIEEQG